MNISLQQMRAVVAVAETNSFTAAAHRLYVTQPAISRAVKELERQLSVRIFTRTTKVLMPTVEGVRVIEIAREALQAFDEGVAKLQDAVHGTRRTFRIAALPSVAALLLPGVAAHMRSIYQDVDLRIFTGQAEKVNELVESEKADIGITIEPDSPAIAHFNHAFDDELICATSRNHRFSQVRELPWRELTAETFLQFPPNSSTGKLTSDAFSTCGKSPHNIVQTHDLMSAAGLAAAGIGVTVIPDMGVPLTKFAALSYFALRSPQVKRSIGIISRDPLTHREMTVLKKIREIAGTHTWS